jgi:hypothetical protein
MDWESDEESDEEQKPKYSVILSEEEYEDEGPESYEKDPLQDNFEDADPSPEIEGWDPRESHNYFRLT